MGFRYRKSLRIARGMRLNLTGRGVSSFFRPGSTLNFGQKGVRGTVGIPGSGLSYSSRLSSGPGMLLGLIIAFLTSIFILAARRRYLGRRDGVQVNSSWRSRDRSAVRGRLGAAHRRLRNWRQWCAHQNLSKRGAGKWRKLRSTATGHATSAAVSIPYDFSVNVREIPIPLIFA